MASLSLQIVIILYTFASICSKLASSYPLFSKHFFEFYGIELGILALYALLWQQVIKRLPLSIAYANRGTAVFWALLGSVLLFREHVTINNIIGVLIICIGILIVNSEKEVDHD